MGAWGPGPFDNDDALDWAWDLSEGGEPVLRSALRSVISAKGTYDADTGASCNAIAAAEVVAAMLGNPCVGLPKEFEGWLERAERPPSPDLCELAKRAVQRVRADSELKELWDDAAPADRDAWYRSLDSVATRLQ